MVFQQHGPLQRSVLHEIVAFGQDNQLEFLFEYYGEKLCNELWSTDKDGRTPRDIADYIIICCEEKQSLLARQTFDIDVDDCWVEGWLSGVKKCQTVLAERVTP